MREALAYSISALLCVMLIFAAYLAAPGDHSTRTLLLPGLVLSAVLSAATGSILQQRLPKPSQLRSRLRVGLVNGGLVVFIAHLLFGFFFTGHLALLSLYRGGSVHPGILSTIREMAFTSAYSAMFLPATLLVGCSIGVLVEMVRGRGAE